MLFLNAVQASVWLGSVVSSWATTGAACRDASRAFDCSPGIIMGSFIEAVLFALMW